MCFGSARYSVPAKLVGRSVELHVAGHKLRASHFGEDVATHDLVAPGEVSIKGEHYGGPRRLPRRAHDRERRLKSHLCLG